MLLTHDSIIMLYTQNIQKPAVYTIQSHRHLHAHYALNYSDPYGACSVLCCVFMCTYLAVRGAADAAGATTSGVRTALYISTKILGVVVVCTFELRFQQWCSALSIRRFPTKMCCTQN
jgi:hypothetical protein